MDRGVPWGDKAGLPTLEPCGGLTAHLWAPCPRLLCTSQHVDSPAAGGQFGYCGHIFLKREP